MIDAGIMTTAKKCSSLFDHGRTILMTVERQKLDLFFQIIFKRNSENILFIDILSEIRSNLLKFIFDSTKFQLVL